MAVVLVLSACFSPVVSDEARKAIAVLYTELTTDNAIADNKMVGYAEFEQANPTSVLSITVVLFHDPDLNNGKHGFHIHKYGTCCHLSSLGDLVLLSFSSCLIKAWLYYYFDQTNHNESTD